MSPAALTAPRWPRGGSRLFWRNARSCRAGKILTLTVILSNNCLAVLIVRPTFVCVPGLFLSSMRVFHEKRPASPWRTATIKYTTTMKKSTTAIVAAMMLLSVTGANLNAAASNPNPPSAPAAAAGGDSFTLDGLVYTVVDAANNLVELSGNDGTHPTSVNVISPISYGARTIPWSR